MDELFERDEFFSLDEAEGLPADDELEDDEEESDEVVADEEEESL